MAFTIEDFWKTTSHILRDRDIEISPEQWNRYLQLANSELKNTIYGPPSKRTGAETSQYHIDALQPFKTSTQITLTGGVGAMPSDYWHKVSLETSAGIEISILETREFKRRANNSITGPSTSYPIAHIEGNYLQILPNSITPVILHYWKQDYPLIAWKDEYGIDKYDSSGSTQFLWKDDKYMDLMRVFTGLLGLNLSQQELLSYTEQKVAANN